MADKFMQHDGIETGYFEKRRKSFNDAIGEGIKLATGGKQSSDVGTREKKPKTATPNEGDKRKAPEDKAPEKKAPEKTGYRKQVLDNGRVMHFNGSKLVSKDEYEKNTK